MVPFGKGGRSNGFVCLAAIWPSTCVFADEDVAGVCAKAGWQAIPKADAIIAKLLINLICSTFDEDLGLEGWMENSVHMQTPLMRTASKIRTNCILYVKTMRNAKAMRMRRGIYQFALAVLLGGVAVCANADDLRINLPRQGRLTPVQSLNRDGVKAVKTGHMDRAKKLFVQAYLLDPDDPFTLNNLGYISEMEGDADHALKYYQLGANTRTEAVIDEASKPGLKGQSVNAAFSAVQASGFASNRANLQAVVLLQNGRAFEAESILRKAMQADPK